MRNNFANAIIGSLNELHRVVKHIKDAMIKTAIGKVRAYEAEQRKAAELGDEQEVRHLQTMIDEWKKILEDLLND